MFGLRAKPYGYLKENSYLKENNYENKKAKGTKTLFYKNRS